MTAGTPRTVLVLRFSAAGDVLLTAPAVEALARAWPDARIVFATKPAYVDLVRTHPGVHAVVALEPGEGTLAFRRRIAAAYRPDAVLDLHGKARGRLLRTLAPRACRAVWRNRPWRQSLAVRLRLTTYRSDKLVVERYHEAVECLVGGAVEPGRLSYRVAPVHRARAEEVLREHGLDPARPICGMAPGSLWETKRWPPEHFGELAARLGRDGVQVVLTGSRDEAGITAAVRERAPAAIDLGGVLGLGELAGFAERCALFVANDSGPMHIARAVGTPTLALFGSTDPHMFDFTGHELLFLGLRCSPCSLYGRARCPEGHFRCMRELDVERAYAAAKRLLAGGRAAPVRG